MAQQTLRGSMEESFASSSPPGGRDVRVADVNDRSHLVHPLTSPRSHAAEGAVFVTSGLGAEVVLGSGQKALDGTSGLWCVNVGHGRTELADAAAAQMRVLAYSTTFGSFSNLPAAELAARIAELAPPGLERVLFTSGGSEANESAFKLARRFWWARGKSSKKIILSHDRAYHGLAADTTSATRLEPYRVGFGDLSPLFAGVPSPYRLRCPMHVTCDPQSCEVCTGRSLEAVIKELGPDNVGAFIAEPVIGTGGVIVPPVGYLRAVREVCTRHEVLLIADEVITGFGRTGSMFGVDWESVLPDMITFAKGVTSGYIPLGGVIMSRDVWEVLSDVPGDPALMHGFTYSGHPVACAVGLANLNLIQREHLVEQARDRGKYLARRLVELLELDEVCEVRTSGLMAGVELVADAKSLQRYSPQQARGRSVVEAARAKGLLTRALFGDIMVLAPPFVVSEGQIDRAVSVLAGAIKATQGRASMRVEEGSVEGIDRARGG